MGINLEGTVTSRGGALGSPILQITYLKVPVMLFITVHYLQVSSRICFGPE